MEKPTIVVPYFNEPDQLRKQEEIWKNFDNRVIIIDDHSEVPVQTKYEAWRIDDDIPWNQPGAKNLGMHVAPDGWILLHDIDHYFPDLGLINEMEKETGTVYRFRRCYNDGIEIDSHLSALLIERNTFWNSGGFNECFSGSYGYDDIEFIERLLRMGVKFRICNIFSIIYDAEQARCTLSRKSYSNYALYKKCSTVESVLNFKYHKL